MNNNKVKLYSTYKFSAKISACIFMLHFSIMFLKLISCYIVITGFNT